MSPIQQSYVHANGLHFHLASIENGGPLVLFLHGFPDLWYSWRHQLPAVAALGYRVWAPDLRGYNLSDKPRGVRSYHLLTLARDIRELIRAAGAERATVVGHDWGAIIAWRFAMEYPENLDKLVILNVPHPAKHASALANPRQWLRSWYIGFFQIPRLPEILIGADSGAFARSIREMMVQREAFSDADVETYAQALSQPGALRAEVNYYRALARWGAFLPIKSITAPTLMIWGERDAALEKSLTYGTERWVEDFRIHYVDYSGHWVHMEAADEVNRVMTRFLGRAS